jgi:hypothetical protein
MHIIFAGELTVKLLESNNCTIRSGAENVRCGAPMTICSRSARGMRDDLAE